MKKFTFVLSLLVMLVTTAMAQTVIGTSSPQAIAGTWDWTGGAYWNDPTAGTYDDLLEATEGKSIDGATFNAANVRCLEQTVEVVNGGHLSIEFLYKGGNHRMDLIGVDLVKEDGSIPYYDYHVGFTGGNKADNVYNLTGVEPGTYTLRYFASNQKNTNSRGNITINYVDDPLQYAKAQFEAAYVKAETLLDRAYKTTETKVDLQVENPDAANYLWCNVPDPQEGSISYLIDGSNGTYDTGEFFHSSWHAEVTAPLHYLQVDMGEGKSIEDFYIAYHTRNFHGVDDFPKEIQVMGSNEKDANFVEIANITSGLPQKANTGYKSSLIRSIKSYRYIRFNIRAPRTYWHMAEFELIRHERPFAEITDNYTHLQTEVETLKTLYTDTYKDFVGTTLEEYQNAMTAILDAFNNAAKITDPAYFVNGRAYTFVTARGWMGAKSGNDNLISTAYTSNGVTGSATDPYFQWAVYKSEKNYYYLYNVGKGMYMGVEKSNNTAVPFSALPAATTLAFKKSSDATYPIMFSTDGAGVVNHSSAHASGLINWTGGWNKLDDGGSNHKITEVDDISLELLTKIEKEVANFEALVDALVELDAAIATADGYIGTYVGTEYGKYSSSNPNVEVEYNAIKEFRAAVTPATAVADVESKTAAMQALMATFTLNVPAANSYVRIAYDFGEGVDILYMQGLASTVVLGEYVSGVAGKSNVLKMAESKEDRSIFYYNNDKLLSYTAGLYLKEDGGTRGLQNIDAEAGAVSFEAGSVVGTLAVKAPSYLHANTNTSGDIRYIDHCGSKGDKEHDMIVEAVTELPVTVSAAGYASFYAPVALEIPENVEVFYATEVAGEYVSLVKIEGGKIPANTGVIIKADANTYNFAITSEKVAAIEGNIFKGTVNKQKITKENGSYYVLGIVDGKVGMYNAVNGADAATFINAGHKAYMYLEGAASSAGYRFDFDGTTGITEVETENANDAVIYDLTGRRVQDMNRAGIYIVNGKKVLVK